MTSLLQTSCIINKQTCGLDLHGYIWYLMLHALEIEDPLTELFALPGILDSSLKAALSQAHHLSAYTDTTLIQNWNGILVALAYFAKNIFCWHFAIIKMNGTCWGGLWVDIIFFTIYLEQNLNWKLFKTFKPSLSSFLPIVKPSVSLSTFKFKSWSSWFSFRINFEENILQ